MNKIIFKIFLLITSINITYSQTNIYPPSGNVGIGTDNPSATLQIGSGVGNLHYGNNGVLIKFNNGDRSLLELHSPNGQNRLVFQSLSNASYLGSLDLKPLLLQTSGGNIGIGTNNPNSKVVIAEGNDAISIHSGGVNCMGFNRNALDGAIFNTSKSAWQFSARDEMFTLEGYNGAMHPSFTVLKNGDIGMGTFNPKYKLDVLGTIRAREIKVDLNGADFVFENTYKLMPLNELEKFVKEQKHLPEVAPAKEMEINGTDLGVLTSKLLQKIEELTLYTIEQNKELKIQNNKIEKQTQEFKKLKDKIKKLESNKR